MHKSKKVKAQSSCPKLILIINSAKHRSFSYFMILTQELLYNNIMQPTILNIYYNFQQNESDVETSNADDTDSHSADRPCQSCSPKPPLRLRSALQLVPLPAVSSRKMQSLSSRVLTIEDLPRIRKEVRKGYSTHTARFIRHNN